MAGPDCLVRDLYGVMKAIGTASRRGLPGLYIADHASQILHSDRFGDIDIHASVFRASSCFRTCDAGERGNTDSAKVATAFVFADLRSSFEAVHDLSL